MIKRMSAKGGFASGEKKITAIQVKDLREATGASIMECRDALQKTDGNFDKAKEYLKKRGKEKAQKKSARETGEGVISAYIHSNKKIGAMVELRCETDFVAKNPEFQELAHDIAMHVAALAPQHVLFADVPQKDKGEYEHMMREELAADKKPAEIVEKIIDGKVKKHLGEICLMSQKFVKNPEVTVEDLLKEKIGKFGENIQIGKFARFEI